MHIEQVADSNKLLEYIHIKNEKVSAKIYPNLGGSLHELMINGLRIIDGISHDRVRVSLIINRLIGRPFYFLFQTGLKMALMTIWGSHTNSLSMKNH